MFREKIPPRQLTAWLAAGIIPVAIQLLSGGSWIWMGIAGTISAALSFLVWRTGWEPRKWQCILLYVYTVLLLSQLLPYAAQSWPTGNATAVPLILLTLSAWSAQKGNSAAARVGAVLFWFVLIMYLAVLGAGAKDVQWQWLRPQWNLPDSMGLVLLLLPSAAACLLRPSGKSAPRLILPSVFVLAAAIITSGVLSPEVAGATPNAFYEMSRSINLLGVARRFEAVISAGMTVGWFAVLSLLLTVCGALAQQFFRGRERVSVWIAAAAAAVVSLCGLHIGGRILLFCGAVFWVAIPILTQGLEKRKKS